MVLLGKQTLSNYHSKAVKDKDSMQSTSNQPTNEGEAGGMTTPVPIASLTLRSKKIEVISILENLDLDI